MTQPTTTTLSRRWLMKIGIILVVVVGLGLWGLADATVFYPKRGEAVASYRLKEYLAAAKTAGRLDRAKVSDAAADLVELRKNERDNRAKSTGSGGDSRLAAMEVAKQEWLESLEVMWRLGSAPTRIEADHEKQLAALEADWKTRKPPTPLSALDMTFQWLLVVVGAIGGVWLLVVMLIAMRRSYQWDPIGKRLTVPGGATFGPDDLREIDKRQWHKYYVTMNLKDGRAFKLDLLRYFPLEEWVLEMEKIAFPEAEKEEGKKE